MVSTKWRAIAGGLCLLGGSIFQLVQFLVSPMKEADSAAAQVRATVLHPSAMRWSMGLDLPLLLIIPGVLFAGWVAGFGRSRLATVGTVVSFVATVGAGYLLAQDVVVYAAAQRNDASAIAVVSAFESSYALETVVVIYLVGHVIGFVCLGVALARSGAAPVWAGVALVLWPVAEMVGEGTGSTALAAAGFALLVVSFGACALALAHDTRPVPAFSAATPAGAEPAFPTI